MQVKLIRPSGGLFRAFDGTDPEAKWTSILEQCREGRSSFHGPDDTNWKAKAALVIRTFQTYFEESVALSAVDDDNDDEETWANATFRAETKELLALGQTLGTMAKSLRVDRGLLISKIQEHGPKLSEGGLEGLDCWIETYILTLRPSEESRSKIVKLSPSREEIRQKLERLASQYCSTGETSSSCESSRK